MTNVNIDIRITLLKESYLKGSVFKMNKISTKKIVLSGLMIALVFLTTRVTVIPVGQGYFNVGDVAIMITAVFLGRNSGFAAGAIGSALCDLLSGYGFYAPITFIVKGIEGYIVGTIAYSAGNNSKGEFRRIIAVLVGSLIMVAGYFIADMYIMGFLGQNAGYAAAVANFIPVNLTQGIVCSVLGYTLITLLERSNIRKIIN